mgnify:CR=1
FIDSILSSISKDPNLPGGCTAVNVASDLDHNEISRVIVEGLIKQNAIVVFVSQNEIADFNVLKKISKSFFVKDY